MYIQPESEEYVQLIFKQDSQANLENFYGGYAYLDNYYHEKVYFDFAFEYDYKEKTYKFYPKESWYNCWEIRFNGKKKNGEFLENEKSDVIFKINNEKEENKEEHSCSEQSCSE